MATLFLNFWTQNVIYSFGFIYLFPSKKAGIICDFTGYLTID
ncbi:hypothetical protein FLJC2902T_16320 [Flavobacterium limnosediminis JC2902]|uniref:Uncharacterized protein n=1 Tax=Flavobacterium limnosediminis JC2902 TaxID=1341181 RepID=V6SNL3_9FLAO|nr:hypothetical protein FLJC2902T_16320 [Flavobacterium limnosediminis JC2902]